MKIIVIITVISIIRLTTFEPWWRFDTRKIDIRTVAVGFATVRSKAGLRLLFGHYVVMWRLAVGLFSMFSLLIALYFLSWILPSILILLLGKRELATFLFFGLWLVYSCARQEHIICHNCFQLGFLFSPVLFVLSFYAISFSIDCCFVLLFQILWEGCVLWSRLLAYPHI